MFNMYDKYTNLKILGRGIKDEITKKVRSNTDQKLYVIKNLGQQSLTENQIQILNILEKDECPNIVKHYSLENNNVEITTDFINNGDLQDYVNTFNDLNQPIEEKILWNIFFQCAESIKYLHEKNIIHRNIRLENFYMTEDKEIKLGNFRYCSFNNMDENINYPEDGILYKSADTLNNNTYNKKSDIYALGVVFYNLCYFQFPYEVTDKPDPENENNCKYELKKNQEKPNNYSNDLKNLINKMIEQNEEQRPDINSIYEICFEKGVKYTSIESVCRCLSSIGGAFKIVEEIKGKFNFEENKEEMPVTYNLYNLKNYFQSDEKKEIISKDKFIKYIINMKTLLEKSLKSFKKDEEMKPHDIINFIINNYLKEMKEKMNEIKDKFSEKEYNRFNIAIEGYFLGKLEVELKSKPSDNSFPIHIFKIMNINTAKCQKYLNDNKEYDLVSIINNRDFLDTEQFQYHNFETFPRYLIFHIEPGEDNIPSKIMNIPKTIDPYKFNFKDKTFAKFEYALCGFIVKIIKEGEEQYVSIYLMRDKNSILEWKISEGNSVKYLNNGDVMKYAEGTIEIIFYKTNKINNC